MGRIRIITWTLASLAVLSVAPVPATQEAEAPVVSETAWSPTGQVIAFVADWTGVQQIFTIKPDGTNLTPITSSQAHPEGASHPSWSPDGSKIAYDAKAGAFRQIWVVNNDGAGRFQRTSYPYPAQAPAWSPAGGTMIVQIAPARGTDLALIEAETGEQIQYVAAYRTAEGRAAWNAGGYAFAYSRNAVKPGSAEGWSHIFVRSIGGTPQQITFGPYLDRDPAWSPDGSTVAFTSDRAGDHVHIWLMNEDGTNKRLLLSDGIAGMEPCWSPDGTKIAFAGGFDPASQLYVVNADGTGLAQVTNVTEYQE